MNMIIILSILCGLLSLFMVVSFFYIKKKFISRKIIKKHLDKIPIKRGLYSDSINVTGTDDGNGNLKKCNYEAEVEVIDESKHKVKLKIKSMTILTSEFRDKHIKDQLSILTEKWHYSNSKNIEWLERTQSSIRSEKLKELLS